MAAGHYACDGIKLLNSTLRPMTHCPSYWYQKLGSNSTCSILSKFLIRRAKFLVRDLWYQ